MGWLPIALAVKPATYDLPLMAGYNYGGHVNRYFKTQDNIVHVEFCVLYEGDTLRHDDVFATLPEGFRPSAPIVALVGADGISIGTGVFGVEVSIHPSGEMKLYWPKFNANWVFGTVSFLAA